jgi:hypothetical protein
MRDIDIDIIIEDASSLKMCFTSFNALIFFLKKEIEFFHAWHLARFI